METENRTDLRPEVSDTEGNITAKKNKTIDFIAKVVCLLLAFVLWYYAASIDSAIYEEEFASIPVEIVNKSGFAVLSGDGITVDVTLSGNRNVIRRLNSSDIRAFVDISNVKEAGEQFYEIRFELPSGAAFVKASTGSIPVYADNRVSKTVPVEAKLFNYSMSESHELRLSDINDIVITGPEQIVNTVSRAELPVDLKDAELKSGRIYSGRLRLVNASGVVMESSDTRYIRMSADTASVTVSLYGHASIPVRTSFKHGLQSLDTAAFKYSHDSVRVFGEINTLKDLEIETVIDEKTLKSGVPVTCVIGLPTGVENLDGVTSISVTVSLKSFAERELTVPVTSQDGGNVLDEIKITVRGDADILDSLTESDINATVVITGDEKNEKKTVDFEFLGEFDGRVYEIYPAGSPYTVTVSADMG